MVRNTRKTKKIKGGMLARGLRATASTAKSAAARLLAPAVRVAEPALLATEPALRAEPPAFKPYHPIKKSELHVAEVRDAAATAERAAHAASPAVKQFFGDIQFKSPLALAGRSLLGSPLPAQGPFQSRGLMGSVGVRRLTYESQAKYINEQLIKLNLILRTLAPSLDSVKNTLSTWFTKLDIVDREKLSKLYGRTTKWNDVLYTRHIDLMHKILNITNPNLLIEAQREVGPTGRQWGNRNREQIIGILIRDFNIYNSNKGTLGPDRYNAPQEEKTSIDHAFDILEMRRFASLSGITVESLLKFYIIINSPYFLNETGAKFNSNLNGPTGAINKLIDQGNTYEDAFRQVIDDTNYNLSVRQGLWRRNQFRFETFPVFKKLIENDPVLNQIVPELQSRIIDPQKIPMPSHGGQRTLTITEQLGGSKEEVDELVNYIINLFEENAILMQLTTIQVSPEQEAGGTRKRRRHSKKYRTRKH
jgi:hypothetical protein